jgi:hypothetical protein
MTNSKLSAVFTVLILIGLSTINCRGESPSSAKTEESSLDHVVEEYPTDSLSQNDQDYLKYELFKMMLRRKTLDQEETPQVDGLNDLNELNVDELYQLAGLLNELNGRRISQQKRAGHYYKPRQGRSSKLDKKAYYKPRMGK